MAALGERYAGGGHKAAEPKPLTAKGTCPKCGAVRADQQIGLEETPEAYVAAMVEVFRDIRRVLRDDGVAWLNLGDGYNNFRVSKGPGQAVHGRDKLNGKPAPDSGRRGSQGFKEKDLLMIPARVAIALQADGWYLRSDVIWSKPNPMPESIKDRPTSSHEHVFLLTKKSSYFYDAEAVKETMVSKKGNARTFRGGGSYTQGKSFNNSAVVPRESQRNIPNEDGTRNLRNIWNIATTPYPGSHFAVFPQKLAETCIKAGTSEKGCCPICRAPWIRIVTKGEPDEAHRAASGADSSGGYNGQATKSYAAAGAQNASDVKRRILEGMRKRTYEWKQNCTCPAAEPAPCTVLDPFGGAGTVGVVAATLGRDAILVELNPAYVDMAAKRIRAHAEKLKIISCEISQQPLIPKNHIKPRETQMQVTVTLTPHPTVSTIALNQWMEWGLQIEKGTATEPAAKPNGAAKQAAAEKALFDTLVTTQKTHGSPELDADAAKLEATGADAGPTLDEVQENEQQQPAGALPPGVEGPVKKNRGGRPPGTKAEREAAKAAAAATAAAAVNPALVPQQPAAAPTNGAAMPPGMSTGGARPPGMTPSAPPAPPQAQAQQPAMPPQQDDFSNGMYTKEDVRACYAQAVGHDPKGVHTIMRAQTWADGVTKPQWFTVDNIAPLYFDRVIGELGALIPIQA